MLVALSSFYFQPEKKEKKKERLLDKNKVTKLKIEVKLKEKNDLPNYVKHRIRK